jgi:hypothetical protein
MIGCARLCLRLHDEGGGSESDYVPGLACVGEGLFGTGANVQIDDEAEDDEGDDAESDDAASAADRTSEWMWMGSPNGVNGNSNGWATPSMMNSRLRLDPGW